MTLKDFLKSHWPAVTVTAAAVAIGCIVLAIVLSMPPSVIVMATGPDGGAYHEFGKRYQAALAREGVEIRLLPTDGALENLALLRNRRSGVAVALVQGGSASPEDSTQMESLGTVFYEPLWVFHKRELHIGPGLPDLRGRKISVGPMGSGTRALSLELLKRNNFDSSEGLLALTPQEASDKLLSGEIDVAAILNSWESSAVRRLIADDRITLASMPRADAYVALYPFLTKVTVPRGVGDLAKDVPPTDVTLLSPKASLAVNKDLHPAIQYLLLRAAMQIHSGPGIFQSASQFPAAEAIDIPLSGEARQFYKSGPPFLNNYLPYWMAGQISKLLVLLIPVIGVLYPLIRLLPFAYDWTMRSRISRLYGELRLLEDQMNAARRTGGDIKPMVAQIDALADEVNQLSIPMAYTSMLYMLRNHVDAVRDRLRSSSY
jgi:TRAP-type uncharacterized transport system substrate-binding protein